MLDFSLFLNAVNFFVSNKLDIGKVYSNLGDFSDKKAAYYKGVIEKSAKEIKAMQLDGTARKLSDEIAADISSKKLEKVAAKIDELQRNLPKNVKKEASVKFSLPKVPADVQPEISADFKELGVCFEAGAFRSAIILCGRILETALHRKYYDITGRDILETAPGIGLGNLIAKLKESDYSLPPGISEQIHLINQVRIYSVHKKSEAFVPSREQAHAIVLFTLDAVKKMF